MTPILATAQQNVDQTRAALTLISDFAKSMCMDPDYKGSTTTAEAKAKAGAEVSKLLKNLADAKVEIGAEVKRDSFQGMLRSDLLLATKNATDCRILIFNDLKDRLLPKKSAATPSIARPTKQPAAPAEKQPRLSQSDAGKVASGTPEPAANSTSAQRAFSRLAEIVGLPADSRVGWGASLENVEALIPRAGRTVSRTDSIGFNGKARVNEVPVTTLLLFEDRELVAIKLAFDAGYRADRLSELRESGPGRLLLSQGNEELALRACSSKWLTDLVVRLDSSFSKTVDLSRKAKADPSYVWDVQACREGRCKGEQKIETWSAAYKHAEAADIQLTYELTKESLGYRNRDLQYFASDEVSCSLQLVFKDKAAQRGI